MGGSVSGYFTFTLFVISFSLLLSCETSDDNVGESECIADCYTLCDRQNACELTTEEELKTCYDFCSSTMKSDWGKLYLVNPLSCGSYELCEDMKYCNLLGGMENYSCDGKSVTAEVATDLGKNCTGLCKKAELCEHYTADDYCVDYCRMDIENQWLSEEVFECVGVLSCNNFSTCYSTLAYGTDIFDGDVPVDGDVPGVAQD